MYHIAVLEVSELVSSDIPAEHKVKSVYRVMIYMFVYYVKCVLDLHEKFVPLIIVHGITVCLNSYQCLTQRVWCLGYPTPSSGVLPYTLYPSEPLSTSLKKTCMIHYWNTADTLYYAPEIHRTAWLLFIFTILILQKMTKELLNCSCFFFLLFRVCCSRALVMMEEDPFYSPLQ